MKTFRLASLCLTLALLLAAAQALAASDFPLREKYPSLKTISTEDLVANYDKTLIVDVRSSTEFDVAHINKAVLVPISKTSFSKDLEAVRPKDGAMPMAFYCNGHTCAKSYDAAQKAFDEGFANLLVYDGGIFDWIEAKPELSTLMGKTPADKAKIIPKAEFTKHLISAADFKAKAEGANAVVIDVREPIQRKETPDFKGIRNIPLDRMIELLKKKEFADKDLLVFDAVGKQVDWLQYHLVENGYTNYSFLDGGVAGKK